MADSDRLTQLGYIANQGEAFSKPLPREKASTLTSRSNDVGPKLPLTNLILIAFTMNNRRFGGKIGTSSPWIRLREVVPIVSFLVTVTCLDIYRRNFTLLGYRVYLLIRDSGRPMAVQYLKEAVRLVILVLTGKPELQSIQNGKVLVKRDKWGIPSIIPPILRVEIHMWNRAVIKGVLTVLSLYRVIQLPGVLKISTIVDPCTASLETLHGCQGEILLVLRRYFSEWKGKYVPTFEWLFSVSAGPNGKHATWCAPLDAVAFLQAPTLLYFFSKIAPWYVTLYVICLGSITGLALVATLQWKTLITGRLHTLEEAAGKIRVIAITDWWTQCLLKPLHDFLFGILRTIRQDGTHDQHAPLNRLRQNKLRFQGSVWSFDLSAATDRLPVILQETIVSFLSNSTFGYSWRMLLTARGWFLKGVKYLYGTGQPIGAYSSWAILALTHHVLVQVAAMRVGWTRWFPHYALLGDDIVIADEIVAKSYLALMVSLGVEINLTKSVISDSGFCEFAKRWTTPNYDYSPVGAKALLKAFRNGSFLVGLYQDIHDKLFDLLPYQVVGSLTKVLAYYDNKSQRAAAFASVIATLGPSGCFKLPLAGWIAIANQSRVWGGWLHPGLAHAVLWTITSFNRMERDNALQRSKEALSHFYGHWMGVAKGYPALITILSPGFWIYILTLTELVNAEVEHYSTRSIRENTDWSHFTVDQLNELMRGMDFQWGPLAEALDTKNDVTKAARLRSQILKNARSWSPDSSFPGMELVPTGVR